MPLRRRTDVIPEPSPQYKITSARLEETTTKLESLVKLLEQEEQDQLE